MEMAEEEPATFKHQVGDLVVIQGLQKTPEYNDRLGVVKEHLISKARLTIRVFEFDKLLNVKSDNLRDPTQTEFEQQLASAFDRLKKEQIEVILHNNDVKVGPNTDKPEMIDLAVKHKLVPEPVKRKIDMNELIDVPGQGKMTRGEMLEKARQMESLTPQQMRDQLKILTSRSPRELRNTIPNLRNATDQDIQAQIENLQAMVGNPRLRKLQIEALKTGDFSKFNEATAAAMSPDEIRKRAAQTLQAFRENPDEVRSKLQGMDGLSNAEIEEILSFQANADDATLKFGSGGGGGIPDISNLSEEQYKKQLELQLKMFKTNPAMVRSQLEKQSPEVKNMSDEQLLIQLEMMASMSKKEVEQMSKTVKSGAAPGSTPPAMDNLSGDQLKNMFKMQRDTFKRDPAAFRRMVPQMAGLSDDQISSQLDTMADMDPTMLKMFVTFQTRFGDIMNKIRGPLDAISGGRGQQLIGIFVLIVVLMVVYFCIWAVGRLLAMIFPTTFGYAAQKAAPPTIGVPTEPAQTGAAQVELNVEDDAFFQEDL